MTTDQNLLVGQLLEIMLQVALLGKPYPGQRKQKSFFPDVELVKNRDEIIVSNQHLETHCELHVPGFKVTILTKNEIAERANAMGDFPYFSLTEAELSQDAATLSLQLSYAVSKATEETGMRYLSGGGVRVRFKCIRGKWKAPEGQISTWMA